MLDRWADIALPDAWLVAGAVAQTVWNRAHGFEPGHGIADVDIVYFDAEDLSEETEARHAARINRLFADLDVHFDVKNEARVHLWYEAKFGIKLAPYPSVQAAIATFPTPATAIGVRPAESGLKIEAPFGLDDLLALTVRPNKALITRDVYEAKTARWRARWPKLKILGWDEADA